MGFWSDVVNRLNPEVKEVVQKLKDMKCEMVICTGDWVYTSIAVAYNADIITDKNIYVFDLDDNKEIVINHLYKAKKILPPTFFPPLRGGAFTTALCVAALLPLGCRAGCFAAARQRKSAIAFE